MDQRSGLHQKPAEEFDIVGGEMMKRKRDWPLILILAIALVVLSKPVHASQDGDKAVREAAAGFYSALNVLFTGDPEPMSGVWSHADDVTYMGPGGGFQVGWPQVSESWKKQAAMKLGGHVEPTEMHITVGRKIAVVQNYESGTNTNARGKQATILIRATNIFRKEDGNWKMIGHHTDLLSYLK
jgi:ketosteroid isomerase-like protein